MNDSTTTPVSQDSTNGKRTPKAKKNTRAKSSTIGELTLQAISALTALNDGGKFFVIVEDENGNQQTIANWR
jgi:hypothetical protein